MSTLRTRDLTKSYGGRTVVKGVSLDVASGEVVGLLGPNGAGKTTTFYMTVGLTSPDAGRVILDEEDVTDDPMYVRARKGVGYLPQEASIFRGLTVEQNLMAILETLDLSKGERKARLAELLGELNLTPLAKAPAHTLSGGERRRAEITRALAVSPRFMLLDEDDLIYAEAREHISEEQGIRAREEAYRLQCDWEDGLWPPPIVHEWTLERAAAVSRGTQSNRIV